MSTSNRPAEEFWKMRDGTLVAVGDMNQQHLRSALRLMIKWRRDMRKRLLLASLVVEVVEEARAARDASVTLQPYNDDQQGAQ